ncbi:NADH-quinone oxidoreductase subunit NuoE [Marinithermus hydrothermalis]|uniref:NADH-quinone oxidoreductase, E subunit n=1 Tax=Marinithermus hydrothermalis (strain DSM 14884 / JCM 11576 / T1) TaxID=869210 RepID=F2NM03_MARHT|nr:NADH-quinone oxidoreductase subunit NuoE [Marinithermus hydrothermalis]AEB11260.1 NADH-quinone oxidoreductase, E subunit [Marinithermus hydrothermalis DSM 14884]
MGFFDDKQDWLEEVFRQYPPEGRRSAIMPLLRRVQTEEGYVSEARIREIAELVGTTPTEVKGVMSFYSYYHELPTGKYHLQVCATLSCALAGADELWDYLVETLGILPGEVTPDGRFSIQKVECLGSCHTAPVVQVNDEPYVECVTRARLKALLEGLKADRPLEEIELPEGCGHVVRPEDEAAAAVGPAEPLAKPEEGKA